MSDLVTIRLQQARVHTRAGSLAKAIELLEQARALASRDRKALLPVVRELVQLHRLAGNDDRAAVLSEELDALSPGERGELGDLVPIEAPPRRSRWMWVIVTLLLLLLGGAGTLIWLWAGHRYDAVPALSTPPASSTAEQAATPPADSAQTKAPLKEASPLVQSASASLSGNPPAAAVNSSGMTAGKRAQQIRENVGLLLQVARYQGTVGGRTCRLEMPVQGGTCFAVGAPGMLLTNKHVTKIDMDKVPADLSELHFPTLTRREVIRIACFGQQSSEHHLAEIVYESPHLDVAVVKVDRRFSHPLKLADTLPELGDRIYACGYPGAVMEFLNGANSSEIRDRVMAEAQRGSVSFVSLLTPGVFEPTLTAGIVSARQRRVGSASYIQVDAKVSHGNSGGPLLDEHDEVAGILTLSLTDSGHDGYNFALSISQLRGEIAPYLRP